MSYEHKPHKTNAHQKQHTPKERKEDSKSAQSYRYVAYVSFSESKKVYTFGCDVNTYKVGDKVIVETIRGLEMGDCRNNTWFRNGRNCEGKRSIFF